VVFSPSCLVEIKTAIEELDSVLGMRRSAQQRGHVFGCISPEQRVRKNHPLRPIHAVVDKVLKNSRLLGVCALRLSLGLALGPQVTNRSRHGGEGGGRESV